VHAKIHQSAGIRTPTPVVQTVAGPSIGCGIRDPVSNTLFIYLFIYLFVRFEVFTEVTIKNGIFWNVTPCASCKNRRFGGTQRLHHQGDKNRRTRNNVSRNCRLLVTANVVPSSPILITLMMEELSSSEMSVLTRATRRNIPEDAIIYLFIPSLNGSVSTSDSIVLNGRTVSGRNQLRSNFGGSHKIGLEPLNHLR
jgi:hypothetical protein